jgi:hypothetical protein
LIKVLLAAAIGIAAFHLAAAVLVWRLTEPRVATALVAAPVSGLTALPVQTMPVISTVATGTQEAPGLPFAQVAPIREVAPIIIAGPTPAVVWSEPAVPFPEDAEGRAERLEEVRQVRAIGPLQELDVRAATRIAAAASRRQAMGIRAAQ